MGKNGFIPYVAIVAIVTVIAVVVLILNLRGQAVPAATSTVTVQEPEEVTLQDNEGNVVGQAFRINPNVYTLKGAAIAKGSLIKLSAAADCDEPCCDCDTKGCICKCCD